MRMRVFENNPVCFIDLELMENIRIVLSSLKVSSEKC